MVPHVLTLTLTDGHDPDSPSSWDRAELACPHDPPVPTMECATLERCGCPFVMSDMDTTGDGTCPTSVIGRHVYVSGDDDGPYRPTSECWAVDDIDMVDAVSDLELAAGRYTVHPWSDGDYARLDLMAWVHSPTAAGECDTRGVPTREIVEHALAHDNWCDRYGEHRKCCPGRAGFGCQCGVADILDVLIDRGWLKVEE